MIRREYIHAFRNVIVLNLVGWVVKCQKCVPQNTIQRTPVVIQPFGTDKSVPYEQVVAFSHSTNMLNSNLRE